MLTAAPHGPLVDGLVLGILIGLAVLFISWVLRQ